jgi:putative PIN family toxin of toxin-antitoxin system
LIVVVDASALVSAALKEDSTPAQAILRAISVPNQLIISQEVEDEYRAVLTRAKFDRFVSMARRQRILDLVLVAAARRDPTERVRECQDPGDDKYLSLALSGKADVIVTGDEKHLLPMHPWRGIHILRPAAFMMFGSKQS